MIVHVQCGATCKGGAGVNVLGNDRFLWVFYVLCVCKFNNAKLLRGVWFVDFLFSFSLKIKNDNKNVFG